MTGPPTTVTAVPEHRSRARATTARPRTGAASRCSASRIPVWSRTPELAAMAPAHHRADLGGRAASRPRSSSSTTARRTRSRSPPRCTATPRTRASRPAGTPASGWRRAPMVVVLNSDCRVEPGWDVALYEAASDGRRVAFPYTDHCDGQGFTSPDQGGTAGWCFMLSHGRSTTRSACSTSGSTPRSARTPTTGTAPGRWASSSRRSPPRTSCTRGARPRAPTPAVDMLLQGHRYKYGWKHGVDPHRAPPYYNREIVDYVGSYRVPDRTGGPRSGPAARLRHRAQQDGHHVAARGAHASSATTASTGAARRCAGSSRSSLAEGEPLLARLDATLDAFSDIQVAVGALRAARPPVSRAAGSCSPSRPLEDWIDSRRRHVETNRRRKAAGNYHGTLPRRRRGRLARALAPARRRGAGVLRRARGLPRDRPRRDRRSGVRCATSSVSRRRPSRSRGRTAATRTELAAARPDALSAAGGAPASIGTRARHVGRIGSSGRIRHGRGPQRAEGDLGRGRGARRREQHRRR